MYHHARVAERMYHLAYESLTRRSPDSSTFLPDDLKHAVRALGELSQQWAERELELS